PSSGPATMLKVSASPSASVAVSTIAFAVSSAVVTVCPFATGAWLTCTTVMLTVAAAESTVPSFALNVKLSGPKYPAAGVYVTVGATPLSVPCAGAVTTAYVSGSPSTSVAASAIAVAVSWFVVTLCAVATGVSFTGVMVSVTVATFEFSVPSFALNVKLSGPLYFAAGV